MDSTVLVTKVNQIAVITLNNPGKMNALSFSTIDDLHKILDAIETDQQVRAIVIWGGNEKFFSAGGDVVDLLTTPVAGAYAISRKSQMLYDRIEKLKQPTIAAVGGLAFGGGFELALACDFRVVNESAKLGLTEINLGMIPGGGGHYRLARLIGLAKARECLLLGSVIRAKQAEDLGIVSKIVPVGTLYDEAIAFAQILSEKAPISVELIKNILRVGSELSGDAAYELEARCFSTLFDTLDAKEGMKAFLEKRPPVFQNK